MSDFASAVQSLAAKEAADDPPGPRSEIRHRKSLSVSNTHTIRFGCGCDLCQQPKPCVEFPGVEECERRQEVYRARRAIHAEAVGRPIKQMKIRGSDD